MASTEKKSQTPSTFESSHNENELYYEKDDAISETSSLHLYHNEWDEGQLGHTESTKFSFKDSIPQVNFTSLSLVSNNNEITKF